MENSNKPKKKRLNIKTVHSPFDEDFQKLDLKIDDEELEAHAAYLDTSCLDADACTDGPGPPYSFDT